MKAENLPIKMRYRILWCLLLLSGASCSPSLTTTLNEPMPDVAGKRFMTLLTFTDVSTHKTQASASYRNDTINGFGPGILITCDGVSIIDTRGKSFQNDTTLFIDPQDAGGFYDWMYFGPDTTFEIIMSADSFLTIKSPASGDTLDRHQSFAIKYLPMGPCSLLVPKLMDAAQDVYQPATVFDSLTGVLGPVQPDTIHLKAGTGSVLLTKTRITSFSVPQTHAIVVQNSSVSRAVSVQWQ